MFPYSSSTSVRTPSPPLLFPIPQTPRENTQPRLLLTNVIFLRPGLVCFSETVPVSIVTMKSSSACVCLGLNYQGGMSILVQSSVPYTPNSFATTLHAAAVHISVVQMYILFPVYLVLGYPGSAAVPSFSPFNRYLPMWVT